MSAMISTFGLKSYPSITLNNPYWTRSSHLTQTDR
jgi:hypothetical protein